MYLDLHIYFKTVLQIPEMSERDIGVEHIGPCGCQRIINNSACLDPIAEWRMPFWLISQVDANCG